MTFRLGEDDPVADGGTHCRCLINRGPSGVAELCNTCGMSGRKITQRGAASKENTAFTSLLCLCNALKRRFQVQEHSETDNTKISDNLNPSCDFIDDTD